MPQTTSQVNACDVVVKLDNAAGNLVDISGQANDCSIKLSNALGIMHTFGSRFPIRSECKSDAAITLKIVYTLDDAEAMTLLKDWYYVTRGAKTITIDIPDSSAGGDKFTFEVLLEDADIPLVATEAAPIMVTLNLKPTGTYTCAVIAS